MFDYNADYYIDNYNADIGDKNYDNDDLIIKLITILF
jgi:hypothetical protein